jgi:hypothetical protein
MRENLMNKRSFLKSLLIATIAPTIFLPTLKDSFKWKALSTSGILVPNPEYANAPFEMALLITPAFFNDLLRKETHLEYATIKNPVIVKRGEELSNNKDYIRCDYPVRLNLKGEYIRPFIKQI